ncbi:unnamed protein product [Rotaria sp. Silwood1]|nr:unnamed protein product [Rotaria sp. Silwood1]CAF4834008.1 unnamed protein product [Rotaria sp. Silwood1]CAF5011085.1 unnamed protein product [Rotaria sp. Silwood1]
MLRRRVFIDKSTGDKYCIGGLVESEEEYVHEWLQKTFNDLVQFTAPQLPRKVDLRSHMTPVEKQGDTMTCTSNALAGALEYLLKKSTGDNIDVSRLFIYYNARLKSKPDGKIADSGARIPIAIEVLKESGTCLEQIWPFDMENLNKRPHSEAYEAAHQHKIIDALKVNIDLDDMKKCLALGYPFIFGLKTFALYQKAKKNGMVPMPNPEDTPPEWIFRHAMLAVGYDDDLKKFIVRNSWGEDWGAKGYCYIPYDYMTDPNYCRDAYVIRHMDADMNGQEHWCDDDSDEGGASYAGEDDDNEVELELIDEELPEEEGLREQNEQQEQEGAEEQNEPKEQEESNEKQKPEDQNYQDN